jgi:hypothetical protein
MPLDENYDNHIPAAVRRQSEHADVLARELGFVNVDGLPTEATTTVVDDGVPSADPSAGTDANPPPAPAVDPAPAPSEWEQRYRTLQGKYDAELPDLRRQLTSMQNLIANMQAQPATPAPVTAPDQTTFAPDKADVEAYGEQLIQDVRRWTLNEVQPQIKKLQDELTQLRGGQTEIRSENAQQRLMNALDTDAQLGGQWRTINQDPNFIAWTQQVDPFSGQQRIGLLTDAFVRGDAVRTGNFFRAYIAEHTAVTQPPAGPGQTLPVEDAPRPTLESMAVPGRPSGPAPGNGGAPTEKRTWTNREISAFYRDCTTGKYAGREADKVRIEQDIFSAATEGRVR